MFSGNEKDEDFYKTKEQNMKLSTEKKYLSSEIQRMQKELELKDKLIKDMMNENAEKIPGGSSPGLSNKTMEKSKESYLIGNLKRQYKDLQMYSKGKEEELERIKKNIKVTKLAEMTDELKVYQKEVTKLKNLSYDLASQKSTLEKHIHEERENTKGLNYKILVEEDKTRKLFQELTNREAELKDLREKLNSATSSNFGYGIIDLANECQKYKELNQRKEHEFDRLKADFDLLLNEVKRLEEKNQLMETQIIELKTRELKTESNDLVNQGDSKEDIVAKPNVVFDRTKSTSLDMETIEEISTLIEKMYLIKGYEYHEFEEKLFEGINFEDSEFIESLSRRIFDQLQL